MNPFRARVKSKGLYVISCILSTAAVDLLFPW